MEKKIWLILAIIFSLLTLLFILLVILLPISRKKDAESDCLKKSTPSMDNTNVWAKFPGELDSTTNHIFNIFEYQDDLKSAKVKSKLELKESTEYCNFKNVENENKIYFDAKSKYSLTSKNEDTKNETINTLSLGLFETLETISNPPKYQRSINSIQYLFKKAFQSPDSFIRHIFAYEFFNNFIKYEDQVRLNILNNVEKEKSDKILSDDEKYSQYSFKSLSGFYQWIKILNIPDEITKATWLTDLFKLNLDEIDSILGKDQYLYKQYLDYNHKLAQNYKCKDENFCGNEIIYTQLISGKVLTNIDSSLQGLSSLYQKINPVYYPFSKSPELYLYFEEYKNKLNQPNIKYEDYQVTEAQLEKILDNNSHLSVLSANNSALFLSLMEAGNIEKVTEIYIISPNQAQYLYNYLYEFLPKLFLYQDFTDEDGKTHSINPTAKGYSTILENHLKKTYYKLSHTTDLYNLLLSKYVWRGLHYKLLNASMEYDDEDICPLLMQHILDDGRKVLQICSDPVTSFKTPYELSKWFEPYYCIKSGNESNCNMNIITHLKKIVYITNDEIKGIYNNYYLNELIEEYDEEFKKAFNCPEKCDSDYLAKIQFWNATVSKNLPVGFSKSNTISNVFPDLFPYPPELSYIAEKMGYTDKILEEDIDYLISLSPKVGENILNEENSETFNKMLDFEKEYSLYIEGKKNDKESGCKIINLLNNGLLFNNSINTEYENVNNLLQGSSVEDEKYIKFLSNGEYYENYKPNLNKTTGFNFGINLETGEETYVEYDRYGINTNDNSDMRKIISINDLPALNIKKLEYNYLSNDYSYINSSIFNSESLTGEKRFIDGFQYNHEEDTIYYYDKISSRPFKFTYSEEVDYGDQKCRKYLLSENDLVNNINEKEDLDSNKAYISQKLNRPIFISIGKDGLDTTIEEDISSENYICVEVYSNMVVESKINFLYSLYTKNYGYIYPNIENDKVYPIFTYNKNYKVDIDSFNNVFPYYNSYRNFRKYMIIFGIILIVIFAILAGFCVYKLFSKNQNDQNDNKNDESQVGGNLINDTREPTQAKKETS